MLESFTNSYGETFKVGDKVKFVRFLDSNPFYTIWVQNDSMYRIIKNSLTEGTEYTIRSSDCSFGTVRLENITWNWCIDQITKVVSKPVPHVHAELIKMWADDPTIKFQYYNTGAEDWIDVNTGEPTWHTNTKYRVKPKVKIEKRYRYAFRNASGNITISFDHCTEDSWELHAKNNNIKEFVRLDFSMKEFEVEE